MQADLVFVMLVFSMLAIIFVISKLNRAIRLLNNRVNIHTDTLKKLKKNITSEGDDSDYVTFDDEKTIKEILDREFK